MDMPTTIKNKGDWFRLAIIAFLIILRERQILAMMVHRAGKYLLEIIKMWSIWIV